MQQDNAKSPPPAGFARHADDAPPFFRAVLTPHRSLGRRGFTVLMLVLGGLSLIAGLAFLALGAWPVFGFFGLDMALIWLAFRHNYRAARAFDEVHVGVDTVWLRKVSASGGEQIYQFNPAWLRLEVERHEDEGQIRLALRSHGHAVSIGDFLSPPERADFTAALGAALAAARAGRPA